MGFTRHIVKCAGLGTLLPTVLIPEAIFRGLYPALLISGRNTRATNEGRGQHLGRGVLSGREIVSEHGGFSVASTMRVEGRYLEIVWIVCLTCYGCI